MSHRHNTYIIRAVRAAVVALALPWTAMSVQAQSTATPRWENIDQSWRGDNPDDFEVSVRDNYIYVYVSRPTTVRLLTILGQPVSQTTIPAGASRLRIPPRGIYIIQVGSATRRITI